MRKDCLVQARLMVRLLPHVAAEESFALKGGTAINFFIWDMPRLSVDIDLGGLRTGGASRMTGRAISKNVNWSA